MNGGAKSITPLGTIVTVTAGTNISLPILIYAGGYIRGFTGRLNTGIPGINLYRKCCSAGTGDIMQFFIPTKNRVDVPNRQGGLRHNFGRYRNKVNAV